MIPSPPVTSLAANAQATFHPWIIHEVARAVELHDVVLVGMSVNYPVKYARRDLQEAQVAYHYLEYGGYLSMWKERLALKLWTGWPTFPQIFVRGTFIGGGSELRQMLRDGSLKEMLAGHRYDNSSARKD